MSGNGNKPLAPQEQLDTLLQLLDGRLKGEAREMAKEALNEAMSRGREKMQLALHAIAANRLHKLGKLMEHADAIDIALQKKLESMTEDEKKLMTSFDLLALGRYFSGRVNDVILLLQELSSNQQKGGGIDPNSSPGDVLDGRGRDKLEVKDADTKVLTATERDKIRRIASSLRSKIKQTETPEVTVVSNVKPSPPRPRVRRKKRKP